MAFGTAGYRAAWFEEGGDVGQGSGSAPMLREVCGFRTSLLASGGQCTSAGGERERPGSGLVEGGGPEARGRRVGPGPRIRKLCEQRNKEISNKSRSS